ncbi:MRL1, partial [Symbiodinium pilosum]
AVSACAATFSWQQAEWLLEDMKLYKVLPGGDLLVAVATACSIALQPTKALKLLTDTELWLTDFYVAYRSGSSGFGKLR